MTAVQKIPYSPADNDALRRLYPRAPMAAIRAALPGRTLAALTRQANKLGVRRIQRNFLAAWTEEEEAILLKCFPTTQKPALLALLPGRTWAAISSQAVRCNLRRVEWHRHAWSAEHLALLREHFPTKGGAYVSRLVGRPPGNVSKAAVRYGVKREWPAPAPRVRTRPTKAAKPKVAKVKAVKVKAKPKPIKVAAPKPAKAPKVLAPKPLPMPGVQSNVRTPNLNALKNERQRERREAEKKTDWLAGMRNLPAAHPARMAYTIAARHGGAAAKEAYFQALKQAA
jgi:hypothetical protein